MDLFTEYSAKWDKLVKEYGDPRVKKMFMMSSFVPSALICIFYVIFVFVGPRLMKNREPYCLKNIIAVYNLFASLSSGYIFYEFLASGWFNDYSFGCQPVDYSNNPKALRMIRACWLFFFTKFIDLLDTVFFILRKKNSQVTFLHVFHHGIMPISCWFAMRFVPGGFGTFGCLLNSFIHFLMYFYYFLTTFGDRFKGILLFFKPYMTSLQMIQFVLIIVHGSQLVFIECDYPIGFVYWTASYMVIFLIFFANFYIQEYIVRKNKRAQSQKLKKSK